MAPRLPLIGLLAIPVIVAILMLPGLSAGPSLDAAVFQVTGWQLAAGDLMYVEAWDHKPPGIHVIHALSAWLPAAGAWTAAWLLTVAASAGAALVVVELAYRHVGRASASLAGIGCAVGLGQYVLSLGGGMSESFAVLPAALALAASSGQPPRAGAATVAGVTTALAVIISPQLVPASFACLFLFARSNRPGRQLGAYLASGALTVLALLGLLAAQGAIPAFVDAVLIYNGAYRGATADAIGGPLYSLLSWVTLALVALLAPAAAGALAARRRGRQTALLAAACLLWILGSAALTLIQGRLYGHYALSIVVPLSVLAGIGLDDGWRALRTPARRSFGVGVVSLLALLSLGVGAAGARMELDPVEASNRRAEGVASWMRSGAPGDDTLLVWGNEPYLHRLGDRQPATRYSYLYPLTTAGYATTKLVAEMVQDLEADPPGLIVDAGSSAPGEPGFLPLLRERGVATDGRDLDLLDPVRSFVESDYELAGEVGGWLIYRLRDER